MTAGKSAESTGGDKADEDSQAAHSGKNFWVLAIGAVGVVFGDIGTSPLYAFRESIAHVARNGLNIADVYGVISLMLWSILIVVFAKYVLLLLLRLLSRTGGRGAWRLT